MKLNRIFVLLSAASLCLAAISCSKEGPKETISEPKLSADLDKISVGADAEDTTVIVNVTATRSWRASIEDDWAYISGSRSCTNDDKKEKTSQLKVKIETNNTLQSRTTNLVIKGDELEDLTIRIIQAGKENTNTLSTSSELSYPSIPWGGSTVTIDIESNTSWTATLADDAPENFGIMKGDEIVKSVTKLQNDRFTVKIRQNTSTSSVQTSVTVVDVDHGCTPIVFSFTQEGAPSVTIDSTATVFRNVPCYGFKRTLVFNAASPWTAEAGEGTSIDKTSGSAGNGQQIVVTFNEYSGTADRKIGVTVKGENNGSFTASWLQNRVSDYPVFFRVYPDKFSKEQKYRTWTDTGGLFNEPLVSGAFGKYTLSAINANVSPDPLALTFVSNFDGTANNNFGYEKSSFLFGSNNSGSAGGYIIISGVPGKRISRFEFFNGGITDKQENRITITDADGNLYDGGREYKVKLNNWASRANSDDTILINSLIDDILQSPDAYACWELKNTKAGEPVYVRFSARAFIRWFTIYFEDAE